MSKWHLSPKTEGPEKCIAQEGNCDYGADYSHYDTKEEAQKAFEENAEATYGITATIETTSNESKSVEGTVDYSKMSKTGLNNLAKVIDSEEEIDQVISADPGARALTSLVDNPNTSVEQIGRISKMKISATTRSKIDSRRDLPLIYRSDKEWERYRPNFRDPDFQKLWKDDRIDDRVLSKVNYDEELAHVVSNPNNQVSEEALAKKISQSIDVSEIYPASRGNDKVDRNALLDRMDKECLRRVAVKANAEDISEIYARGGNNIRYQLSTNPNTPSNILEEIAVNIDKEPSNLESEWAAKEILRKKSELSPKAFESFKESKYGGEAVAKAETHKRIDSIPGGPVSLLDKKGPQFLGRGKYAYHFNPDKVREAGFSKEDVDLIVRETWDNWLSNASYDERTGIYQGYND